MERYLRHRYALSLPFVALILIAFIGGIVNGVTARGRVVDDFTSEGVKDAELTVGRRVTRTADDGSYVFENVPRTTSIGVDYQGYFRTSAPPEGGEIRMQPTGLQVVVNEEGTDPPQRVITASIRQETRVLGTTNTSGNSFITPHPGRDAKLFICAKDFASKEVAARGLVLTVTLVKQPGSDCPPLPTPSPDPNASPSPSPSPGASPSPGGTPTPSPSPP